MKEEKKEEKVPSGHGTMNLKLVDHWSHDGSWSTVLLHAASHSPPLQKSPLPLLSFPLRAHVLSGPNPERRYLHTVAGPPCAPAVSFPGRLR
ncbi:hypothetical protein EYF80_031978 [Liparis tanakae]|uniref:Uncharacterized protein n=1 Tax=Liparis tanakae TaxID=230148 RepID=A0A4Z2GYW1_9TELE|nr:hypothetical protein EYF80_031978 [Liparis tanakae]